MASANNMTDDKERLKQAVDRPNVDEISEDEIDRNLMGTFPASDPPSWTLGVGRKKKPVNETPLE
jgi:hypothetical protein